VILKIKRWCAKKGNNGVRSLVHWFQSADKNRDMRLSPAEFSAQMKECGVGLTPVEIRHLTVAFDIDGDGYISLSEFLLSLSGGMMPRRRTTVERVWASFDHDRNGDCALDQVVDRYRVDQHPQVLQGTLPVEEAASVFLSYFNYDTNPEGLITQEEFFAFYAGVSANIPNDEYFEAMMYGVWGLEEIEQNLNPSFGNVTMAASSKGKTAPYTQSNVPACKRPPQTSAILQSCYANYGPSTRSYDTTSCQANAIVKTKHRLVDPDNLKLNPIVYETTSSADYKGVTDASRTVAKPALSLTGKLKAVGTLESNSIVDQVRDLILKKGGKQGYRGLSRVLRIMDDNGNKLLDKYELQNGIQTYGLKLTAAQMDQVMEAFDTDSSGQVSVAEFINVIRGPLADRRLKLVQQAYSQLVPPDGVLTFDEMKSLYDTKRHPDVMRKEKSVPQAFQEFVAGWELSGHSEVSWESFCDYYTDLSAGILDDDYFEQMMRNVWHVSGGLGKCAASPFRRVLVTHTNGKQTVQELVNDIRIRDEDTDLMLANLQAQGITDVKKISLMT